MKLFDENLHLNDEGIAAYVDALKLNTIEQLPESVLEHVSECATCKLNIEELFQLLNEETEKPEEKHPIVRSRHKLEMLNRAALYRIAAVFLVGFGLYGVIRLSSPERNQVKTEGAAQNTPSSSTGIDSSIKERRENLLTDNYAVSPELEALIGVHYRSSDIEVESPKVGERIHDRVDFSWTWGEKKSVNLRILNNTGKEVFYAETKNNSYRFTKSLDKGLYYWRLETSEELLYVGKFIVEK